MKRQSIPDVLDVRIDSNSPVVDAFSQYPLLDGSRKYTCEVTEFACPLDITLLPELDFFEDDAGNTINHFFEVRRKRVTGENVARDHLDSSLSILLGGNGVYGAPLLFPHDFAYKFRKTPTISLATIGGFVNDLQRFFATLVNQYTTRDDNLIERDEHGGVDVEVDDPASIVRDDHHHE